MVVQVYFPQNVNKKPKNYSNLGQCNFLHQYVPQCYYEVHVWCVQLFMMMKDLFPRSGYVSQYVNLTLAH